ncbi:MAG TPA: hypothetical protein VFA29_04400 [Candidatus Baltobacteraceae bacterium]|nr:hypothetical protein [Candidatus Baltobacteraceae bacterium]
MLVNALFCTALLALTAGAMLSAGMAMTRATVHRLAGAYAASGYQQALQSVTDQLAAEMENGGLPSPMPTPSPPPKQCADRGCRFWVTESVQFTTIAAPAAEPSCDGTQPNCATAQTNAYIAEGRATARIWVVVGDSSGGTLASKSGDVTFRTLHRAPYAVVADARDGSFDGTARGSAPGDDGGIGPATPDPCASSSPGTSDDTLIRVAYRNVQTDACSNAGTFSAQAYSQAPSSPAGW